MRIWVDADACPRAIKEILFRGAERVQVRLTLVANRLLHVPRSAWLRAIRVPRGFDEADQRIVELVRPGDLVVTADVPLAAAVLEKDGQVLDPRGRLYTEDNIQEALAMRDLADGLRSTGVETGGPPPLDKSDRQAFANELDRILARYLSERDPRPGEESR
jgi:uncharacterized protein YaiI (UPF0178 family)